MTLEALVAQGRTIPQICETLGLKDFTVRRALHHAGLLGSVAKARPSKRAAIAA